MKIRASMAAFGLLAGCVALGQNLATLESKQPKAGDFHATLALEYLSYAQSLMEQEHPVRADYFAGKGLQALEKNPVPLETKDAYRHNRQALAVLLTPDTQDIAPDRAARAQVLFDCWMEGSEVCRASYAEALADLQFVADTLVHGEHHIFSVPFAPGRAELGADASVVLDLVASRLGGYGDYRLELLARSKRAQLNTSRLLAVEEALIARGVHAGALTVLRRGQAVTLSSDHMQPDAVTIRIISSGVASDPARP